MPRSLELCSLPVLLSCALMLRVAFLWLAGANAALTGDELAYHQIAMNVAAGHGLYQTNNPFFPGQVLYAWQAPLYPLALGLVYRFAGANVALARMCGVLVSTATVYVVYDLAKRVFRETTRGVSSERVGWAAGFLVAIYPGLLTNAHLLLSETLFTFLLMLAFDLVARALDADERRWVWLAGAGVVMGLATLTRGITLYFTPLLATWIGWWAWREGGCAGLHDGRGRVQRGIVSGVLFGSVALAMVAPYAVRNFLVFQRFVLLETKGGVNLWLGNSPYTPPEFIRNVWKPGVREPMLDALPRDEVARDRAAYTLAIDYIRRKPLIFVARMPVKFADFWGFERNLVDTAETTTQSRGWTSASKIAADLLAAVVYVFVMVWGVAGFCCARGDRWQLLFGGFVSFFLLAHLVIFGDGRFHLPVIPLFALYAGWLLAHVSRGVHDAARRMDCSKTRVGVAVLLVATLITVWGRETWVAWHVLGSGL